MGEPRPAAARRRPRHHRSADALNQAWPVAPSQPRQGPPSGAILRLLPFMAVQCGTVKTHDVFKTAMGRSSGAYRELRGKSDRRCPTFRYEGFSSTILFSGSESGHCSPTATTRSSEGTDSGIAFSLGPTGSILRSMSSTRESTSNRNAQLRAIVDAYFTGLCNGEGWVSGRRRSVWREGAGGSGPRHRAAGEARLSRATLRP